MPPCFVTETAQQVIQDATDHNSRTESPVAFTGLAGRGFVICLLAAPTDTRGRTRWATRAAAYTVH